jgi:hypothetical protein
MIFLLVFKLDTGAQANIISDKLFRSVSLPNSTLEKTGVKLVTYDGHRINPEGLNSATKHYGTIYLR